MVHGVRGDNLQVEVEECAFQASKLVQLQFGRPRNGDVLHQPGWVYLSREVYPRLSEGDGGQYFSCPFQRELRPFSKVQILQ